MAARGRTRGERAQRGAPARIAPFVAGLAGSALAGGARAASSGEGSALADAPFLPADIYHTHVAPLLAAAQGAGLPLPVLYGLLLGALILALAGAVVLATRAAGRARLREKAAWRALALAQAEDFSRKAPATPPAQDTQDAAGGDHGLRALVDGAPAPAWLKDPAGLLIYVNPAFAQAVGAPSPEAARAEGHHLFDGATRAAMAEALGAGRPFHQRVKVVSGGRRRVFDVTEAPHGASAFGLAFDVTAEEDALAERARIVSSHRGTLDQLATAVVIFDKAEKLVFHNAAYERLFGLEAAFLDAKPTENEVLDVLRARRKVPEQADFRAWRQHLRDAYRALEPVNEWWHLPGGQMLRVVVSPNAEGGVTYLFDDLSERMALESRYNSLIRIQGETLDGLAEAVAVFGSDGRLNLYNEAFLTLWSLSAQALGAKPHIDAVAAMCRPLHGETGAFSRIRAVVTGIEQRENVALRLERADGRVLDGTAQPLPDGGTLVTFRDVTDSVKVQRALKERNEALEAADALKNAFVGHVSYHLRTPLNTLIGYAHMLGEDMAGPLNGRQRDFLGHIRQSSEALRALIDDILDLATIDAGAMALDKAEVPVRPMLEAAGEMVRDQLDQAGVTLSIDADGELGSFLADGQRMRQVLFNLISNAVTASPEGGVVSLGAERRAEALVIAVRDRGPGIAPEEAERLFQRFEIKGGTRHRGVGLGLPIVRSFVELHGGKVTLAPRPGGGTIATCTFPLNAEGRSEAAE